ncbi:MAG: hypothetical protein RLZZ111_1636 [Planctomycetota bacterium]
MTSPGRSPVMSLVASCRDWLRRVPPVRRLVRTVRALPICGGATRRVVGRGNVIDVDPTATLRRVTFAVSGHGNLVRIGPGCMLEGVTVNLRGDGQRVVLAAGVCVRRSAELWIVGDGGAIDVGAGTTFESATVGVAEAGGRLTIGADCMFAHEVDVRTGDSHSILDAATGARLNPSRDISIGDHVWVGGRCIILKGVVIPRDCVVAAGAVVTKPVAEPGTIVGGNPARVLKTGVTWDRRLLP